MKAANSGGRQKLADKVNILAEEMAKENKDVANILWGVCGAILLKRERSFSRLMKSWTESRINEVHKKKEKRQRQRKRRKTGEIINE